MKRLLLTGGFALALAVELALPGTAAANFIVGRNAKHATLQVDSAGRALISFTSGGQEQHVLVWGAVNALVPIRGKDQVQFKVDYSGGSALKLSGYYKTIKNVCKPYDGPKLAWYVAGSGCKAPDGTYWALQMWQRMLPDLGFKPWKPEQSVWELQVSHWSGPLAVVEVSQDWAWGGKFHQLLGRLTYGGKPVYGFSATSTGVPNDSWGRNLYLDTFGSPYGKGWFRENSFLGQLPNGGFCYSFQPRPPYPGYPASPPRLGIGKKYRITVLGPGVTPAVMWQGNDVGNFNAKDAKDPALEAQVTQFKSSMGFSPTECHS